MKTFMACASCLLTQLRLFMLGVACTLAPAIASAALSPTYFVRVGNPNNPPDEPQEGGQFGAVAYEFEIGKFNVTVAEYAEFLNAAATTDPNGLFNESMEITREGDDGAYKYKVNEGRGNRPIRFVEALDGLRYCNWLHNGGSKTSDTETGAYTFADPSTPGPRHPGARYFLPTENEWYKAAYYDPTKGGTGGYWLYAVRADTVVAALPPGTARSANFDAVARDLGEVTDVGAYTSARSYYGTFDQTGNTWEWLEPDPATPDMSRRRSGSWENNVSRLSKTQTGSNAISTGATQHQGIRIARPATATSVRLTIKRVGNNVEIAWNGSGRLEGTASVSGPWSVVAGAANPATLKIEETPRYYRVAQ